MYRLLLLAFALPGIALAQPLFDDVSSTNLPAPTTVSQSSMDVEAADLDGDGDLDLVVAGEFQFNKILLNDGNGVFTDGSSGLPPLDPGEVPGPLPPAHDTEDIAVEDFNGDGHLDIIFVSEDDVVFGRSNVHEYYHGDGTGQFTRVFGVLPDTEANAVLAADLTGDAHLDLVLNGGGQDRLLVGDGTGNFADETDARLPKESDVGQDVEAVDVDDDGDLDLVVGNEGGHRLWLNDGTGHFTDETAARLPDPGNVEARKVTPVDIDADGDLDLYFSHVGWQGRAPQDRIYRNDGTGHFTDATLDHIPAESQTTLDAKFADIDADGDLDLIRINLGPVEVLLNDGTGTFTDATASVLPAAISGTGVGVEPIDLNDDGALDLYIALLAGPNFDPSGFDRLLLNTKVTANEDLGALPTQPRLEPPFPNPTTSDQASVAFSLPEAQAVRLTLLDARGRQTTDWDMGWHTAGRHVVPLRMNGLASGTYTVLLTAADSRSTQRLTYLHADSH